MSETPKKYRVNPVEDLIVTVRGQKVILDHDLAFLYGVSTKRLNEQVKRNLKRFPPDFMFRLSVGDVDGLMRSQFATASKRNIRHLPYAFTEHGTLMAANVLNSVKAVDMCVFVIRAFVKMREHLSMTQTMGKRLAEIENTLLIHDSSLVDLYQKIRPLLLPRPEPPKRKIGFNAEDRCSEATSRGTHFGCANSRKRNW